MEHDTMWLFRLLRFKTACVYLKLLLQQSLLVEKLPTYEAIFHEKLEYISK